jgi:hypothetical protein
MLNVKSTQVTLSATSQLIASADAGRSVLVVNSNSNMQIGDSGVSTTTGLLILSVPLQITGKAAEVAVYAVSSTAGTVASVLEITTTT